MAKQSLLLTGATGLIGRHVARNLSRLMNLDLVCIIRGGQRHPQACSLLKQGVTIVDGNFYDPIIIREAFEKYRFHQIVHLAAIRGGGRASAAEFQEINVDGTERLLREAYAYGAQKFIFCSSVGVYGTVPVVVPAGIESPLQGDNDYHKSKIAAEAAVQHYLQKGLNAYIVRPTITYGPGDDGFPHTLSRLVKWHLLFLPKSDHQVHLVDVERVAEVFLDLVVNEYQAQRIFVVTDIKPISLRDLANCIHSYLYNSPYPDFLRFPDWVFKLADRIFRMMGNEKWAARMALLSNDWHYQCADTYHLLDVKPVPTGEAFSRFLRDLQFH